MRLESVFKKIDMPSGSSQIENIIRHVDRKIEKLEAQINEDDEAILEEDSNDNDDDGATDTGIPLCPRTKSHIFPLTSVHI